MAPIIILIGGYCQYEARPNLINDQVKRLKDLGLENSRLRKAISDPTLDKLILTEAAKGNTGDSRNKNGPGLQFHPWEKRVIFKTYPEVLLNDGVRPAIELGCVFASLFAPAPYISESAGDAKIPCVDEIQPCSSISSIT